MKHIRSIIACLGILGFVLFCEAAMAQSPGKNAGAHALTSVPAEPQTTVASYGDWVVRCQRVNQQGKVVRVCEAAEAIQVQGQAAPIAQIAIGRLPNEASLRVTVATPPAVSFPSSVRIAEGKGGPTLTLEWRRCLPGGCFADAPIGNDVLARWRGRTDAGQLTFKDAAGQDATLPISFRGLAQALDALAKEGR